MNLNFSGERCLYILTFAPRIEKQVEVVRLGLLQDLPISWEQNYSHVIQTHKSISRAVEGQHHLGLSITLTEPPFPMVLLWVRHLQDHLIILTCKTQTYAQKIEDKCDFT